MGLGLPCERGDRSLVFLIEFLSDGGDLAQFELGEAQAAPAVGGADERPNISLSTGFSPKPLGMIFNRRRSSTNSRASGLVTGMRGPAPRSWL